MTDGEGRVRFQYEACQEQGEVQEDVRLSVSAGHRTDAPDHNGDPEGQRGGGGREEEQKQQEEEKDEVVEKKRRGSCGGRGERRDEWSIEVQECEEEQEPELEMEAGPTLGVRITAPIRDPDCVSEEEEQQPYPALAPVAFFCLKQTTRPRNWCLRMVCNPYPFICRRLVSPNMSSSWFA